MLYIRTKVRNYCANHLFTEMMMMIQDQSKVGPFLNFTGIDERFKSETSKGRAKDTMIVLADIIDISEKLS